jgi:hypothetical protein
MRVHTLWTWLFAGIVLQAAGCGAPPIKGRLLKPPALSGDRAESLAEQAAVPTDEWPLARPAAVRIYPSGEVIVDVLVVVSAVEPDWSSKAGAPVPESEAVFTAAGNTNGLNVPARLHGSGRETGSILLVGEGGSQVAATRAVLGEPPFEQNFAYLYASDHFLENTRVIAITRGGRRYHACFVPVLLSTDETLRVGEKVDVRIKPRGNSRRFADDRWYRLTVEPVELTQDATAREPLRGSIGVGVRSRGSRPRP